MLKQAAMSEAEEFRKSTAEFWSKIDQKGKVVAERRKLAPARVRDATPRRHAVATASKTKKRSKR
jgi:hypothetical protein